MDDARRRLRDDVDAWVATADPETGTPHMVPLSFLWDEETMVLATALATPTGRNLCAGSRVRIGLGTTRDVVLLEGTAEAIHLDALPSSTAEAFAAKTGFEPRALDTPYLYFRITPRRLQAWREVDEIAGRDLLRDGRWLPAEGDPR